MTVDLVLDPEQLVDCSTSYERLTAVGFDVETGRLTAEFITGNTVGVGEGQSPHGELEHVRFHIDHGWGWIDAGATAVDIGESAHTIGFVHVARMTYRPRGHGRAASRPVLVRAILSYEVEPPLGEPHWRPVWGDVREALVLMGDRSRLA